MIYYLYQSYISCVYFSITSQVFNYFSSDGIQEMTRQYSECVNNAEHHWPFLSYLLEGHVLQGNQQTSKF